MSVSLNVISGDGVAEAIDQLRAATAAKKCWSCGCLHGSLDSIERAIPANIRPQELDAAIRAARDRLVDIKYECLGCEICWPPLAMNALNIDAEACPTEQVQARPGWPPLPGSYTTLRYHAPVAICALSDEELAERLVRNALDQIAIVGTVHTENLGIERIIQNIVANPNIRFLVVCGADSRQAIGHLPGQSLLALAQSGVDEGMRIIGARGRRPVLKNLSSDAIEHFRKSIEVVDLIGQLDVSQIAEAARRCAERNPGPAATPLSFSRAVEHIPGYIPERMVSDPSGYMVIYPDCARGLLGAGALSQRWRAGCHHRGPHSGRAIHAGC